MLRPDADTNRAFVKAFESFATVLGSCQAVVAAGTEHEARINATGDLIAVAGFKPAPSCKTLNGVPAAGAGPFDLGSPAEYILGLNAKTRGQWAIVLDVGLPFPCPPLPGEIQYVPDEVVKAWQLKYYSSSCRPTYTGRG